ncbi:MAG: hypothetical protein H7X79_08285 [Sporomusaceae bacterium]|nr:hypothetical protein [Sporomusaceae bacterium]
MISSTGDMVQLMQEKDIEKELTEAGVFSFHTAFSRGMSEQDVLNFIQKKFPNVQRLKKYSYTYFIINKKGCKMLEKAFQKQLEIAESSVRVHSDTLGRLHSIYGTLD